MADSSDIDAAIVTKLAADATLTALLDSATSVYIDIAPENSKKFVIVSLTEEHDEQEFGERAFEDALYLVEVRMREVPNVAVGNVKAAAARIDTLLDGGTLTVAGYSLMVMQREERHRNTEQDELDPSILWHRRGGHYRVSMST